MKQPDDDLRPPSMGRLTACERGMRRPTKPPRRWAGPLASSLLATVAAAAAPGCESGTTAETEQVSSELSESERAALVDQVLQSATAYDVTPIPPAPEVSDELFELGQSLAFDKILSGNKNISCMSCHDPRAPFFTGDNRHLALGEGGVGTGEDRLGGGIVPRNSQALFNLHALSSMFWDNRVRLDPGEGDDDVLGQLRTPAGEEITPEMQSVFEFGVVSAQAMFPVVSRTEMRGQQLSNFPRDNEVADELDFTGIWSTLMDRLGEIPEYVEMFEAAYPGTAFEDMTFAHAANAIAGFEIRAFENRGSPFQRFLDGEDDALSDSALRGARDFFAEGSCASCHSGPMLSDQQAHNIGLAQFGPGRRDGPYNNDDFGTASDKLPFKLGKIPGGPPTPAAHCENGENPHGLYSFRTAPLHNVALTGPWGHLGQFSDLRDFVAHYADPVQSLTNYDPAEHLAPSEQALVDMRTDNVEAILSCLSPGVQNEVPSVDDIVAFLESLTDPAALDLDWVIPEEVPSGLPVDDGTAPEITGVTEGTISFSNIADDPNGPFAAFSRVPSARNEIAKALEQQSLEEPMDFIDHFQSPVRWRGLPGVAIFDYTGDGAMDIYVTNGPGAPNALYENQLAKTGQLEFVERAVDAGVAAIESDSTGVCYGDINNNGYPDLYVVADSGRSHFFMNNGDGTFTDISEESGATPEGIGGTSCAFGDINGNGKLDLFVGRAWHQEDRIDCFVEPFGAGIQHNELYINQGDGVFEDVSATSGILDVGGLPPGVEKAPTITWAVAMVDINQNGYLDILHTDDQCGLPEEPFGGLDRGFIQIFENDGTGHFVNRTVEAGTNIPGGWMGLSFGDFNQSGELDFFATNFGNWGEFFAGAPVNPDARPSRWFLGQPDGTFVDPHVGELQTTPFGWGTSARDFDNDGHTDVVFQGGLDMFFFVDASNPGTVLLGDGKGAFRYDPGALETNYSRRNVAGVAAGDLNGNGFPDIVTVSNFDIRDEHPLVRYGAADRDVDFLSAFDETAYFVPTFSHVTDKSPDFHFDPLPNIIPQIKIERLFQFNPNFTYPNGSISVELNSADNGNNWAAIELVGSVGLIKNGAVNRSGIGATITFVSENGTRQMAPVLGGSSHLSQDSLVQGFGLGDAEKGTVDILWPGGTKNRLYDVEHGERLRLPEIPCSYDTSDDRATYEACVDDALAGLSAAGVIDSALHARLRSSAMLAYDET